MFSSVVMGVIIVASQMPAHAAAPEAIGITCDVDRKLFRNQANRVPKVRFQLWKDAESLLQGDLLSTHEVALEDLVIEKVKPERYGTVRRRPYNRIEAVIGTNDGAGDSPVDLGEGDVWMDVKVGLVALSCDEGKRMLSPPVAPPKRRKLESVAFVREADEPVMPEFTSHTIFSPGGWITESTNFGDLPTGEFTAITVDGTERVNIWFAASVYNTSALDRVLIGLVRDTGSVVPSPILSHLEHDAVSQGESVAGMWSEVPPAGTHRYRIQWCVSGGTGVTEGHFGLLQVTPGS